MMDFTQASWEREEYAELLAWLENESEPEYAAFTKKGISSKYPISGVRIPKLRKLATQIKKGNYPAFLAICDQSFFETVLLRGLVTAGIKDLAELEEYFWDYAELVDYWCLCDTFCSSLKIMSKNQKHFLPMIETLIATQQEFKVRIGLVLLLCYYVDAPYLELIFNYLRRIQSEAYYVQMAEAWLICEVFVKFPEPAEKFLAERNLPKFVQNKAISKIRDSYRVDQMTKDRLVKYRI